MRENFQTWRKGTKFFVWGKQFLNIFCALTDLTLWNQRKLIVGFLKFCNQSKFYRNRYRRTLKRWTFRSSWVFTWFKNQQNKNISTKILLNISKWSKTVITVDPIWWPNVRLFVTEKVSFFVCLFITEISRKCYFFPLSMSKLEYTGAVEEDARLNMLWFSWRTLFTSIFPQYCYHVDRKF